MIDLGWETGFNTTSVYISDWKRWIAPVHIWDGRKRNLLNLGMGGVKIAL
jgi:hypothetical protein